MNRIELSEFLNSDEVLEPETLRQLFPEMDDVSYELALVVKVLKWTNSVFNDMDVFENCVQVLNGVTPDINNTQGVRPEWIWKALELMKRIRPDMELAHEVRMYIKWACNDEGIYFYPPYSGLEEVSTDIIRLANTGPFPLKDTFKEIQAYKYLKIQAYLKDT